MLTMIRDLAAWAPLGVPAFIFVIALVVVIHELGHFLMARACGVAVETFSICFGREIFGWTDNKGTRWKIGWLPFGGYVKFAGDADATSTTPDAERIAKMSDEEKARAYALKPVWQRALISAAGPFANFVLAFVVFTVLYGGFGAKVLSTYVGSVTPNTPAAEAGIKPGDRIAAVDGKPVRFFDPDLVDAIRYARNKTIILSIERGGKHLTIAVTPRTIPNRDVFGTATQTKGIGVGRDEANPDNIETIPIPWSRAPIAAAYQCWGIVDTSLTYLWRIVSHKADASQLGGPVRIAKVAKSAASSGLYELLNLVAFISVSIGLLNLFPVPPLDGGHLLYYACEGVMGRPLPERFQSAGIGIGLVLVIMLMLFATWNDVR